MRSARTRVCRAILTGVSVLRVGWYVILGDKHRIFAE